jgi:hypothetical protein
MGFEPRGSENHLYPCLDIIDEDDIVPDELEYEDTGEHGDEAIYKWYEDEYASDYEYNESDEESDDENEL